jgi:hypothetical protein
MLETLENKLMDFCIDGKQVDLFDLKIEQGKIYLTLKFKGETEPLNVSADYAIQGEFLCLSKITTSKKYLNALIFLSEETETFKENTKIALKDFTENECVLKCLKAWF